MTAIAAGLLGATVVVGCSSTDDVAPAPADDLATVDQRLEQIQQQLDVWATSDDVAEVTSAAEQVRNLVTGPGVEGYGDANSDGEVVEVKEGLLPGADGTPSVADALEKCAGPDLFGGSWNDPSERWQIFYDAYSDWTPTNNTFPGLPSHPQRVVGWASLTLEAADVDKAREYAGHAQLHVDAAVTAAAECR